MTKNVLSNNVEPNGSSLYNCDAHCYRMYEFYELIDAMVTDILCLEEDLVRWRKALIPHLNQANAEGLQSDILDGMARNYVGMPAYDLFLEQYCNGQDPMENEEHCELMIRLRKGIDDTSVFLK